MNYRSILILCLGVCACNTMLFAGGVPCSETPTVIVKTDEQPVAEGKFQPAWQSLKQYRTPEWFRDAKFGIWAHWGAQCQPEAGDWYARNMYFQSEGDYKFHVEHYGHPSTYGFKDVVRSWKAENWDPEKLMALYKRAGAQYFIALANHHDNFDNWDSRYQPWNAVKIGPGKDLIAGWAAAARKNGMRFGVSVHAAHAWSWYESAQGADKSGPLAGVPYDGKLKASDGKGKWWDGLDPQDLYAQNHAPSPNFENSGAMDEARWNWQGGVSQPDAAYCQKFFNRTMDLMEKYKPDLVYFDDTALPLWPVSDAGLKLAAHFHNRSNQWHGASDDGVWFGKVLNEEQQQCMTWDIERGVSSTILPYPWQTDTCIGNWHYDRSLYERNGYKSAKAVIHMLVDIVSKNGNLLLSVPVRADGTIDEREQAVVEGIADWMAINKQAIFGTRPWKVFGEGPASDEAEKKAESFNEGNGKPFTAQDVRFTTKGNTLYAIVLGVPSDTLRIKSLGKKANDAGKMISSVQLLGDPALVNWKQDDAALNITPPEKKPVCDAAIVYEIKFQ